MKFEPRAPREGVNVSEQHPLEEAFTLIAGLTALLAVAAIVVIFFVDLVILFIPPKTESWLFQDLVIEELVPADYDGDESDRVADLVSRLARHWPENPYQLRSGILTSDQPNALALPGGVILVTSTLLDQAESENELAFVLGHEIGHFRNRDHLRQLGRAAALGLILVAVIGQDASLLSNSVITLTTRSFSRDQESEADRFGLELVHAEYGHVAESWRFFERIEQQQEGLSGLSDFLATHPSPEDRVAEIKQVAEQNSWALSGPIVPLVAD